MPDIDKHLERIYRHKDLADLYLPYNKAADLNSLSHKEKERRLQIALIAIYLDSKHGVHFNDRIDFIQKPIVDFAKKNNVTLSPEDVRSQLDYLNTLDHVKLNTFFTNLTRKLKTTGKEQTQQCFEFIDLVINDKQDFRKDPIAGLYFSFQQLQVRTFEAAEDQLYSEANLERPNRKLEPRELAFCEPFSDLISKKLEVLEDCNFQKYKEFNQEFRDLILRYQGDPRLLEQLIIKLQNLAEVLNNLNETTEAAEITSELSKFDANACKHKME